MKFRHVGPVLMRWFPYLLITSLIACSSVSRLPADAAASGGALDQDQVIKVSSDVAREKIDASRLPDTLDAARQYFLDHSPYVREMVLAHEVQVSDIAQNEGGYSNPTLGIGRFTSPSETFKRLIEVGFSISDLLSIPSANRALDGQLALADVELEADIFELLLALEEAWLNVGLLQARSDLAAYRVRFLVALAALSSDFLDAGNIPEADHIDRALMASHAQNARLLAQQQLNEAKTQLAQQLGLPNESVPSLMVPLWQIEKQHRPSLDQALSTSKATNKRLQVLKANISLLDNEVAKRRWARWLQNVGFGYEIENEGVRQEGPKLSLDVPLFDTQVDALGARTLEARLARLRVEVSERALEFEINRLIQSLDHFQLRLSRIEEETLPLLKRRAGLLQQKESYMLIDVFELAEAKLEHIEQVEAWLDLTHAYWLDRLALSRRMGSLLAQGQPFLWQDALPGFRDEKQVESHDEHERMYQHHQTQRNLSPRSEDSGADGVGHQNHHSTHEGSSHQHHDAHQMMVDGVEEEVEAHSMIHQAHESSGHKHHGAHQRMDATTADEGESHGVNQPLQPRDQAAKEPKSQRTTQAKTNPVETLSSGDQAKSGDHHDH